jgi:hypothetical protein
MGVWQLVWQIHHEELRIDFVELVVLEERI